MPVNANLVLVVGDSGSGKSQSLEFIRNPESVMYLNCESGKYLPFDSQFKEYVITDPLQVHEAFDVAETKPEIEVIVVDGLNYLMDMFESVHIIGSSNTMQMWSEYAQFFKKLMQQKIASSTKQILVLAHSTKELTEDGKWLNAVPVKGATKGKVESYFSSIVVAKCVPLKTLKGYESDLLNITEDDEELEFKWVFQTRKTKDCIDEKMRNPRLLFNRKETYMDNDAQLLLDRLNTFYTKKGK